MKTDHDDEEEEECDDDDEEHERKTIGACSNYVLFPKFKIKTSI